MSADKEQARLVYRTVVKNYPFLSFGERVRFEMKAAAALSLKDQRESVQNLLGFFNNPHAILYKKYPPPPLNSADWIPSLSLNDRILFVRIPTWDSALITEQSVTDLIEPLAREKESYDSVILDVRGNRGGVSELAHKLASVFFKDDLEYGSLLERPGLFLRRQPCVMRKAESHRALYIEKPVALLTDTTWLSANEHFIAPFKVSGRGTLVGTETGGGSAYPLSLKLSFGGEEFAALVPTRRFILKGESKPLEVTKIRPDIYCDGPEAMGVAKRVMERNRTASKTCLY